MKIKITGNCKVSTDGINVINLKVGGIHDFTDDLAKIVVESMKTADYYKEQEQEKEQNIVQKIAPQNKSMGETPENKISNNQKKEKVVIDKEMRVSEFSHKFKYASHEVISAAMNLSISATHQRSKLTANEANKILTYLQCR